MVTPPITLDSGEESSNGEREELSDNDSSQDDNGKSSNISKKKQSTRHQAQSKDTVMAKLTEQMTANKQLHSHIQSLLSTAQVSAQQLRGSWIGTVSESFYSSIIDNFYQESFDLVQRNSMKSKELSKTQQQQPKQQNSANQNANDNMSTQQSNFQHRNTDVNLQQSSSARNTDMPIHDQHVEHCYARQ